MAQLTATEVGGRRPSGQYFERTFRCTTGTVQSAEWIDTGFSEVLAVVGYAQLTLASVPAAFFRLNGQGTGTTEGSTPGALGINTGGGGEIQVTVLGR